jgi:hypothetical protein
MDFNDNTINNTIDLDKVLNTAVKIAKYVSRRSNKIDPEHISCAINIFYPNIEEKYTNYGYKYLRGKIKNNFLKKAEADLRKQIADSNRFIKLSKDAIYFASALYCALYEGFKNDDYEEEDEEEDDEIIM